MQSNTCAEECFIVCFMIFEGGGPAVFTSFMFTEQLDPPGSQHSSRWPLKSCLFTKEQMWQKPDFPEPAV